MNRPKSICGFSWRASCGAFTLIELLLAIVLVALVMAAVTGVFYGSVRLRNRTTARTLDGLPLQQTVAQIRRDLAGLVQPGGIFSSNLITDSDSLTVVRGQVVSPPLFTNTGRISDFVPWGDIQCVRYYLRNPTNRTAAVGMDLFRVLNRNLLSATTETPEEQWLMSGVERVQFSFYDGTQWKNSWNSTNDLTLLPRAIKLEMVLAPSPEPGPLTSRVAARQVHPVIQLVSPVVLTAVTNSTSTAGG